MKKKKIRNTQVFCLISSKHFSLSGDCLSEKIKACLNLLFILRSRKCQGVSICLVEYIFTNFMFTGSNNLKWQLVFFFMFALWVCSICYIPLLLSIRKFLVIFMKKLGYGCILPCWVVILIMFLWLKTFNFRKSFFSFASLYIVLTYILEWFIPIIRKGWIELWWSVKINLNQPSSTRTGAIPRRI